MTDRAIVLTTINPPTRAVADLASFAAEWPLIVVGDNKTPRDWAHPGATFIGIDEQKRMSFGLAVLLPENHYCRKNLGYLSAIASGCALIAETDDDNLPEGWPLERAQLAVRGEWVDSPGWVNVYEWYTEERIWPRGFPLEELPRASRREPAQQAEWRSPIHQFLAAGDPDVDAVYRLTVGKDDHTFQDRTLGLAAGSAVPFNSQCTVWFPSAFMYMYLPSFVSFRMTDIWRSFVAQAGIWARGESLTYHGRGVRQERNDHDLKKDFDDEVVGYQRNAEIMRVLQDLPLSGQPGAEGENLRRCYDALHAINVVPDEELPLVDAWVADVEALTSGNRP